MIGQQIFDIVKDMCFDISCGRIEDWQDLDNTTCKEVTKGYIAGYLHDKVHSKETFMSILSYTDEIIDNINSIIRRKHK